MIERRKIAEDITRKNHISAVGAERALKRAQPGIRIIEDLLMDCGLRRGQRTRRIPDRRCSRFATASVCRSVEFLILKAVITEK